jgi:CHAT domain-containing protein
LHVLTRERDVLPRPAPPDGRGLLAMGGADFDRADSSDISRPAPALVAMASEPATRYRGTRSGCEAFSRLRFGPLPGTGAEVSAISKTWEAARPQDAASDEIATGARASEALFKRAAPGRRIAHLATHGFFVDVGCAREAGAGARGVLGLVPAAGANAPFAAPPGENPLLLSGLALAGANERASASAGEEDGVLTSDEIAALDLSGMEWAVLSACGTGLGELAGPEGVLGLRRAFLAAGARTVFTSLWSVRDQPTREWMEALYRHRFAEGAGTAEAARLAALDLLRSRRARKATTHPFEWAAFLAVGDWR